MLLEMFMRTRDDFFLVTWGGGGGTRCLIFEVEETSIFSGFFLERHRPILSFSARS